MAAEHTLRGIRFPGRYIQGPEALSRLGEHIGPLGRWPLVLLDRGLYEGLEKRVLDACGHDRMALLVRHGGECSLSEMARIIRAAGERTNDVIVGIGGGKVLDTAKAVAHKLDLPVVVVPTIASSDAPCSALAVIYGDDGTVSHNLFLPRNPDLVLVDTALIARAPSRFLTAGIGDALATYYEADACRRSGAGNCMALRGVDLAYAIASRCRDEILNFGGQALVENDAGTAGAALERVIEANILLSGIGFESGGVASAHAIHNGLCELHDVHDYLHGEKVAIGVLAGLLLSGETAEFDRIRRFCQSVRLPTRLSDIGITDASEEKLAVVAKRATRAGEIIHNEPMPVTQDMVVSALRALV